VFSEVELRMLEGSEFQTAGAKREAKVMRIADTWNQQQIGVGRTQKNVLECDLIEKRP